MSYKVRISGKQKRVAQVQDPSLYYSTPTFEKASSHAPLKTAFLSHTTEAPSSTKIHFSQSSSSSSSQKEHHQPVTSLKTENFDKVTVEIAKEHMGLLSTFVSSYDGLVAGHIGNPYLKNDDYSQIDPDDMERIDIMWALESANEQDKACVAEIKKLDDQHEDSTSGEAKVSGEETSGSESENLSDSDTLADSDAYFEESPTQFALMLFSKQLPLFQEFVELLVDQCHYFSRLYCSPTTPLSRFRLLPFRSPLLRESLLLSFSLATKMFQFARLSLACPWIQQQFERLTYSGISGSMLIFNSLKHFVAYYALPRLWVPRYPP
ncbi:hypothetical protein E3N88_38811 [Mikania micrantha]|uniref:Uncharacterized protein n=1 Tax=Mikania micrantha TaxID=192012 RepID=A0A5N6LV09_9ASTR|nr:hypothetical protein E3N88_38811 [Mikania micrantha]